MLNKTSLILIILLLIISSSVSASTELSISQDKKQHFVAGALVYSLIDRSNINFTPMAGVFIVGLGKEVYDHYTNGTVEEKDFQATILGGLSIKLFKRVF